MVDARRRVLGVILAGGRSARFGGGDKARALLGGRMLIARVAERLAPQVDSLAINSNVEGGAYAHFDVPLIADAASGREGPLAGIVAALRHACEAGFDDVATVPCDAPLLRKDLVARLKGARDAAAAPCAFARADGRLNPVFALYDAGLADAVAEAFARGMRAPRDLVELLGGAVADFGEAEAFADIDTEADLAAAALRLSQ